MTSYKAFFVSAIAEGILQLRRHLLPILVTYQGRPVKRRFRAPDGLRLILFHEYRGVRGEQLVVSQDEWKQFGRIQPLTKEQMPDVRALAAECRLTTHENTV